MAGITLPYGLTFNGVRGTRSISWSEDPWIYTDSKHDEAILIMFEHFEWIRPFSSTFMCLFEHTFEFAAPRLMSDYIVPVFYHWLRS